MKIELSPRKRGEEMMRRYSYKKVVDFVDRFKGQGLVEACVCMSGDEQWTGLTVWTADEGWLIDSEDEAGSPFRAFRVGEDGLSAAGITGSVWATPLVVGYFEDGSERREEAW